MIGLKVAGAEVSYDGGVSFSRVEFVDHNDRDNGKYHYTLFSIKAILDITLTCIPTCLRYRDIFVLALISLYQAAKLLKSQVITTRLFQRCPNWNCK